MERMELAEDAGMLFVLESEQTPGFYMKNTLIPLSIAFINSHGYMVGIQDMQTLDESRHYPAKPAQYALEVNQGFFAERGVQVGATVELPQPTFVEPPSSAVVEFFVDGQLMKHWTTGIPDNSMKLYVNAWYPNWLRGRMPSTDQYLLVDKIQYVQH